MIRSISRLQKRLQFGRPITSVDFQLIHTRVLDKDVMFCVNMENDPVQRNHRRGTFYEINELVALKNIFKKGGTFIDIGANVGNHSLFAAMFLGAKRVVPFEPNPRAFNLLVPNVLVNHLTGIIDTSMLGVGLSDAHSTGFAMENRERNLGGAKMLAGQGDLAVFRGDELLKDEKPDFIKIDVESMELQVLAGLSGVLEKSRPIMMVEVDNTAEAEFMAWIENAGYGLVSTHQRYRLNKNHVIADKSKIKSLQKKLQGTRLGKPVNQEA